jgi:hypothetical protein
MKFIFRTYFQILLPNLLIIKQLFSYQPRFSRFWIAKVRFVFWLSSKDDYLFLPLTLRHLLSTN